MKRIWILLGFLAILLVPTVKADAENWCTGCGTNYDNRTFITITNPTTSSVILQLNSTTIPFYNSLQRNGADICICSSDNVTRLAHYLKDEYIWPSGNSYIIVVPNGNTTIGFYAINNTAVTTYSDIESISINGNADNFNDQAVNTSKWGSPAWGNFAGWTETPLGRLQTPGTGDPAIHSLGSLTYTNITCEARVNITFVSDKACEGLDVRINGDTWSEAYATFRQNASANGDTSLHELNAGWHITYTYNTSYPISQNGTIAFFQDATRIRGIINTTQTQKDSGWITESSFTAGGNVGFYKHIYSDNVDFADWDWVYCTNYTWTHTIAYSGTYENRIASSDTTPPDISWNTPTNNTATNNVSWIYWNATISETPGQCYLNNGTVNFTMTATGDYCHYNMTGLANLTQVCSRVYANDTSGNLNLSSQQCATINLSQTPPGTGTNWCNDSYDYRTLMTISNTYDGQAYLILNSTTIPFYSSLQKNGADLYFCSSNNVTSLPHYLEDDYIYSTNSYVVVSVNSNSSIWLYAVNNTAVGTYSNPESVSVNGIGDNFNDASLNTTKWGVVWGIWTELATGRLEASNISSNGIQSNLNLTYTNITCKSRWNVTMGTAKEFEPIDWRINSSSWNYGYGSRSATAAGFVLGVLNATLGWKNLSVATSTSTITSNGTVQIWQLPTQVKMMLNSTQTQYDMNWVTESNYTTGGNVSLYRYGDAVDTNKADWDWIFCANYSQSLTVSYSGTYETRGNEDTTPPTVTLVSPATGNQSTTETCYNYVINCSATDSVQLANITPWTNFTGAWAANTTVGRTGTWNFTTLSACLPAGNYIWNCRAGDNSSNYAFAGTNYTIQVNSISAVLDIVITNPLNASTQTINTNFILNGTLNCTSGTCGTVSVYPQYYDTSSGSGTFTVTSAADFNNGSTTAGTLTVDSQFNTIYNSYNTGATTANYTSRVFSKSSGQSWGKIDWADAPGFGTGWIANSSNPYIALGSGWDNCVIGATKLVDASYLGNTSIYDLATSEAGSSVGGYKIGLYYNWDGTNMYHMNTSGYLLPTATTSWCSQHSFCPNPFIENDSTTGTPVYWLYLDGYNGTCDVTGLVNMTNVANYSTLTDYTNNPILIPGHYTQYDKQCSTNCHTSSVAKDYRGYIQQINGYYYMTWSVVGNDGKRRTVLLRSTSKFSGWNNVTDAEFIPLGAGGSWDANGISDAEDLLVEDVLYTTYMGDANGAASSFQIGLCMQNTNNLTSPCIKEGVIISNTHTNNKGKATGQFYKGTNSEGWEIIYQWYSGDGCTSYLNEKEKINANLNMFVRYSNDNSSWGSWAAVTNGQALTNTSNYIQFKADFAGNDNSINLHFVNVTYSGSGGSGGWTTINSTTPVKTSSTVPYGCGSLSSPATCNVNWTLNITTLTNYTYRILANSTLIENNSATWTINVNDVPDTTPPNISWNTPATNNTYTQNVSWIFTNVTVSETLGACYLNVNSTQNYSMSVSGYYCSYNLTNLVNNTIQKLIVYANDSSGNLNRTIGEQWVIVNQTGYIDTTPPTVTITSPTATAYTTTNIWLNYSIGETPQATWYKLNGGANTSISFICYQETANASTSCGGLATGTYLAGGDNWASIYPANKTYDTNWSTRGRTNLFNQTSWIVINYSKPANSLNSSFWRIGYAEGSGPSYDREQNLSIPSDCWNYYANSVSFNVSSHLATMDDVYTFTAETNWFCYNGTWKLLLNHTKTGVNGADADIYYSYIAEEGVWWNLTGNITFNAAQGSNTMIVYASDNVGNIGSDSVTFTVDSVIPPLNFVSPTLSNNSFTNNVTWIYVNVSSDEAFDGCLLDWVQNNTNQTMTVIGNYCYANITDLVNGTSYYFRVWANDTIGNLNKTEDRQITIGLTNFNVSYTQNQDSSVVEGQSYPFSLVLNSNSPISPTSAYLVWNGVLYSATQTELSPTLYHFNRTLTIPVIASATVPVFWYITTTEFILNTTSIDQTITEINLTDCSAGSQSQTKTLWYFLRQPATNATINGNFEVTLIGNGESHYFNFTGSDNYSVCIFPTSASMTASATGTYSATGYMTQSYTASGLSLSNATQYIYFYLQNSSALSQVTLNVQNTYAQPESFIDVDIQKYYPGTNTYESVGTYKTDNNGIASAYLKSYDTYYRFVFSENGYAIETVGPMVITSSPTYFIIGGGALSQWFKYYGQASFLCLISNSTNTTTCTLVDTSGDMQSSGFNVKYWSGTAWVDLCLQNSTASSLTYVCSMGDLTKYYWYALTATYGGNTYTLDSGTADYRLSSPVTGANRNMGLIISLIIIVTVTMMGIYRPGIGIVLSLIAVVIAFMISFVPGLEAMGLNVGIGSIAAFGVVCALAIYKLR